MDSEKTIAFVTTGLGTGGAEHALAKLLGALDRASLRYAVVALGERTPLADRIETLGVPVVCLGINGPAGLLRGAGRLLSALRKLRPTLLQGWMLHGNLAALFAGLMLHVPVIWGVRHSELKLSTEQASSLFLAWLLGRLSFLPLRIVYNSFAGKQLHESKGYFAGRALVIGNGFDTMEFRPDPLARIEVRGELAISEHSPVIGMVARYHPTKDHRTFLVAAKLLLGVRHDARFLLVGKDCDADNAELAGLIRDFGIAGAVMLVGERADAGRVMCAFDVGTLTSVSEGNANVIGEMMACGLACAVTDVGDARSMIGDCGKVVPAEDAAALARSWESLLARGPEELRNLGARARTRIETAHSIGAMARAYEQIFAGDR